MTEAEARLALGFWNAGATQGECQNCGYRGPHMEVDHVVSKANLKRLFRQVGRVAPLEVIWDARNARLLCAEPAPRRCHNRWTLRLIEPPPVPEGACEFVWELDELYGDGAEPFSSWLEATYPRERAA